MILGFDSMWDKYPMGSASKVLKDIFGKKSEETPEWTRKWILKNVMNTCTIRISHSLNWSTSPVKKIANIESVTGIKGQYILKVSHMRKYLKMRYGKANISVKGNQKELKEAIKSKKGIICFIVSGWSDATGHFDLWNGSQVRNSEYFTKANQVKLWLVK